MQRGTWTQIAVAAVLVLMVGAVIAVAEEQTLKVKVIKGDGQKVEVDAGGKVVIVELGDLADGEERSFQAGEHLVLVKRAGDELVVTLDGEAMPGKGGCGAGEANLVWVTDDEIGSGGEGVHARHVIMISGDEGEIGERKVIKIECGDGDDCAKLKTIDIEALVGDEVDMDKLREALGDERIDLHVSEGHRGGHPMIIKSQHPAGVVRFRCTEDGTTLAIAKDKASQELYMCPVCGRAMQRREEQEVKVLNFVARPDASPETVAN